MSTSCGSPMVKATAGHKVRAGGAVYAAVAESFHKFYEEFAIPAESFARASGSLMLSGSSVATAPGEITVVRIL
jgi:hypothetical protein